MENKGAAKDALTDQLRDWYEQSREWYAHSPTAQRAYARLRADIDTVVARAQPKIEEFWQQVGPMIDPQARDDAAPQERNHDASRTSAGASAGASNGSGSQPS